MWWTHTRQRHRRIQRATGRELNQFQVPVPGPNMLQSPSPLLCIRLFIALCGFAWFEKLCHYISGQCLPLIPFALWLQTRCQRSQSAEGIRALYEAALIQLTSLAGFSGFYPARLQIEYLKAYQAHRWSWREKGAIFILSASGKETVTHWRRLESISSTSTSSSPGGSSCSSHSMRLAPGCCWPVLVCNLLQNNPLL